MKNLIALLRQRVIKGRKDEAKNGCGKEVRTLNLMEIGWCNGFQIMWCYNWNWDTHPSIRNISVNNKPFLWSELSHYPESNHFKVERGGR